MTTIRFSPTEHHTHTHRITDGTESVWFIWPEGADEDSICEQYENGYDHNGSSDDVQAVIYGRDDEPVMSWSFS